MANPSWKQLARISESLEKTAILSALAIEPPPEGISDTLRLDSGVKLYDGEGGLIVYEKGAAFYSNGSEVIRRYTSRGTPTGDLVRWWLQARGLWQPAAAKPEPKPEAPIL